MLILWCEAVERRFASQRWLTYKQALAAGFHVRRGEKGTVICYADRFTPKGETEQARCEDREARTIAFLKRFVVFNLDQIEGLPAKYAEEPQVPDPVMAIAEVDRLIAATGADFRIGGDEAFYVPKQDYVQVPPQAAFHDPISIGRTQPPQPRPSDLMGRPLRANSSSGTSEAAQLRSVRARLVRGH